MSTLKRIGLCLVICFTFIIISFGCSHKEADAPTISINQKSEYENTFINLNLGILFDFNFYLPHADTKWVNLWVERYRNGEKDAEPLTTLSYGNSPDAVDEGNVGFGMIQSGVEEDTFVFLYGPEVRTGLSMIEKESIAHLLSTWDYALGEDDVKLTLGEPKILAAYRGTVSDSMRTIDLQDEASVNQMIQQEDLILLLKIMIEEDIDRN